MDDLKKRASALLRQYDKRRAELQTLERDLARACSEYGRSVGLWGFNRDYLRAQLERERGSKVA